MKPWCQIGNANGNLCCLKGQTAPELPPRQNGHNASMKGMEKTSRQQNETHMGTPRTCLLPSIHPTALITLFSKQCMETVKQHADDQSDSGSETSGAKKEAAACHAHGWQEVCRKVWRKKPLPTPPRGRRVVHERLGWSAATDRQMETVAASSSPKVRCSKASASTPETTATRAAAASQSGAETRTPSP
jgi:hypothetical protein